MRPYLSEASAPGPDLNFVQRASGGEPSIRTHGIIEHDQPSNFGDAMPTQLLTHDVWKTITRLTRRSSRADVAVAWCSGQVKTLLPLKSGSLLVTDLGEDAVKARQAKPGQLIPFVRNDVAVHSMPGLHAKVFVFDDAAIIGSTNVSKNSERYLVEAAILVTGDRPLVADARDFVRSLAGNRVGIDELKRLQRLWKSSKMAIGRGQRRANPTARIRGIPREPVWVVPLTTKGGWTKNIHQAHRKAEPVARRQMQDRRGHLSNFLWEGNEFGDGPACGEQLLQVVEEARGTFVEAPGRVTHVQRLPLQGHQRQFLVYVEEPRSVRRKALDVYSKQLGPFGDDLRRLAGGMKPRHVRQSGFVQALLQAWPLV